jgi:hypothetical protein
LMTIQSILVNDETRELSNFGQFMGKLVPHLTQQLQDLRSQITN